MLYCCSDNGAFIYILCGSRINARGYRLYNGKETFASAEKNVTDTYDEIEPESGNVTSYPETLPMIVGHTYDFTDSGKHDTLLAVFDDTVASREGGILMAVSCGTTVVAIQDANGFYTCSVDIYDFLSKNLTVGKSLDLNPLPYYKRTESARSNSLT